MEVSQLFADAVRQKVRFEYKGSIGVEDLWDLGLEELDAIYRKLSQSVRKAEDGLLSTRKNKEDKTLELKLSLVRYVFEAKQDEANLQKEKAVKKQKKDALLSLLERKQNAELEQKSTAEIQQMLDELAE